MKEKNQNSYSLIIVLIRGEKSQKKPTKSIMKTKKQITKLPISFDLLKYKDKKHEEKSKE